MYNKLYRWMSVALFAAIATSSSPNTFAAAPAGELRRIGLSLSDLGNPFFVRLARGVEDTAKQLTGKPVSVTVMSSAYDLQRQVEQIDGFIAQKVDLIILTAADPVAIGPAVKRAQAAGIKVIAVDVKAAGADATITTDNVQAGQLACAFLGKRLNGRGNVVIINGSPVSSVVERVDGCRKALAGFSGIRLLSWDKNGGGSREGGLAKMTDLLTAYPKIDGVFTINDPTAIGAETAARQSRRENFVIVSVDGAPSIEQRLKDDKSLIAASAAQLPDRMAEQAVTVGLRMLKGEAPPRNTVLIPSYLVTKQNIASYRGWGL